MKSAISDDDGHGTGRSSISLVLRELLYNSKRDGYNDDDNDDSYNDDSNNVVLILMIPVHYYHYYYHGLSSIILSK